MASYILLVKSAPSEQEQMQQALKRVHEITSNQDSLVQVFFYGPSTVIARNDHIDGAIQALQQQWLNLKAPLVACATVGAHYGLVAPPELNANLAQGFEAGGLTEFMSRLVEADHVEQF
ncbi:MULTISPECIES: DsrE family protein [Gammaproteobacteria]|uniref:DsrE family protein n=1 Tax=Gammaproteobacteria TaxID=1236 RepID=UPI000DD0660C|nr:MULTISPECIES: DsrE family protein [Gammaproteobacteria]RTE87185.1 hypothetical protein DQX04_01990 [Aliidiomarina sp. B3213]TCZ93027.1 hypothetical protein EYQ95_03315 [Lysobacter sp. N42]